MSFFVYKNVLAYHKNLDSGLILMSFRFSRRCLGTDVINVFVVKEADDKKFLRLFPVNLDLQVRQEPTRVEGRGASI